MRTKNHLLIPPIQALLSSVMCHLLGIKLGRLPRVANRVFEEAKMCNLSHVTNYEFAEIE